MKPVNSKSLFHFVCDQMDKLDKQQIGVMEAAAQSALAKQANNLLNYELKRALVLHQLEGSSIKVREIESKAFDEPILLTQLNK